MGKRGPPPQPAAKRKLAGSWPAKERERLEPRPPFGRPDRPDWFGGREVDHWDRLVAIPGADPGLLTKLDG